MVEARRGPEAGGGRRVRRGDGGRGPVEGRRPVEAPPRGRPAHRHVGGRPAEVAQLDGAAAAAHGIRVAAAVGGGIHGSSVLRASSRSGEGDILVGEDLVREADSAHVGGGDWLHYRFFSSIVVAMIILESEMLGG